MYLGNPLLPANISALSAEELIKKKLLEKNWHEYELNPLKLNLVPYFLFNYHYFIEAETGSHKIVKNSIDGILAVDGHAVEVREDLVELIKNNWKKSKPELPRTQFDEKWCNIEKKEQEEILKVKTAEYFEVPKSNVVVSSARKLFLPLYKTTAVIMDTEYQLIVNAVDGSIQGTQEIPERQKGHLEMTKEVLHDLKSPSAWVNYSKEALFDGTTIVSKKISGKKIPAEEKNHVHTEKKSRSGKTILSIFETKKVLLLIIILALILLFAALLKS